MVQQEGLFRAMWLVTRNRHEAEEIVQDAFVRLLERWSTTVQTADNLETAHRALTVPLSRPPLRRLA
jgi:DNA-directed RNA polymerase specialized sigma24 family protein